MAKNRAPENGRIIGDLAFSHTILGHYYQSTGQSDKQVREHFETAEELYSTAYQKAPNYPPITANWSIFYFYTGNYEKAKDKVDEAIKLGYQFNLDYIRELESNLK